MTQANGVAMRCYVCDTVNWIYPTYLKQGKRIPIHSEMNTQICGTCGSACHEVDVNKEEEVKNFYRKEYRPKPTLLNLITTTHKLNYIRVFLTDYLKERKGKQLVIGDVGAATGYLLDFFRKLGHKVTGSELTLTYRRMSEHYYGIPLTEELEPKHKYDLITIYHVLEHLYEPDKKLKKYVDMLSDDGHILIATPEWFDILEEASGVKIQGFDHLFHKNHINLFSKTSIQNLFKKCGLQIVKEDFKQYGQTYLLKKRDSPLVDGWLTKEEPREVENAMLKQREAIELHMEGKFRDAFQLFPRFPDAWISFIFQKCLKDVSKQTDMFQEAEKHVGDNLKFVSARGQWHYQQGRLLEACKDLNEVVRLKPNEDTFMMLGYAYRQAGRIGESVEAFQKAQAMDPQKWAEANSWILSSVSDLPTWDERLIMEAQKTITLKPEITPSDVIPTT